MFSIIKIIFVLTIILNVGCPTILAFSIAKKEGLHEVILSADENQLLQKSYPDFKFLSGENYLPIITKQYTDLPHPPYCAIVDINGDQQSDLVFLGTSDNRMKFLALVSGKSGMGIVELEDLSKENPKTSYLIVPDTPNKSSMKQFGYSWIIGADPETNSVSLSVYMKTGKYYRILKSGQVEKYSSYDDVKKGAK